MRSARSWAARGAAVQSAKISRYGNYALHGKLYVFDRKKILIGSMNFDQRSQRINTEIGLIIGSPDLAQQTALRFEAMVKPENCYTLALSPAGAAGQIALDVAHRRERARASSTIGSPDAAVGKGCRRGSWRFCRWGASYEGGICVWRWHVVFVAHWSMAQAAPPAIAVDGDQLSAWFCRALGLQILSQRHLVRLASRAVAPAR